MVCGILSPGGLGQEAPLLFLSVRSMATAARVQKGITDGFGSPCMVERLTRRVEGLANFVREVLVPIFAIELRLEGRFLLIVLGIMDGS